MSYESAMEAAGAEVHVMQDFGSYQGEWWAKVTHNGVTGWVNGYHGSCPGCDAWQGEFDSEEQFEEESFDEWLKSSSWSVYARDDTPGDRASDSAEWRSWWEQKRAEYIEKVRAFGADYLEKLMTQEEAEAEAGRNIEWDSEAEEMLAFIKANAI